MNRPVLVGFVALLLVASAGFVVASASAGANAQPDRQFGMQSQDYDRSTFEIVVHENGSATWTFQHRRHLTNQSEVENFEAFAEEFESEETPLYERFTLQASSLVATGQNETDREMEATDFERTAYVDEVINRQGIVEMSFTWHGFAVVEEDGTVTVSDVFDGRLPLLSKQSLVVRPDDGLRFETVYPDEPDAEYRAPLESATSVTWEGEMEFAPEQPYVVFVPVDGAGAGTEADGTPSPEPDGDGMSLAAVGALAIVALAFVAFAWHRRTANGRPLAERVPTGRGGAPGAGSAAAGGEADAPGPDPDPGAGTETETTTVEPGESADAVAASTATGNGGESAISDTEFMTDEDRVVSLIRANGGRMKQVNIVEETGWSKSKVSMLLSDMEEEGTISKLRVGRENIISLDGFEPEATKSPFEE